MKENGFIPSLALFLSLAATAAAADVTTEEPAGENAVRGVNPADNLTKFELLPKYARINDELGVSISTVTLKYDRAIKGVYGFNVELPLVRFNSPFGDDKGVGDLNLRFRRQIKAERWTYIVGTEVVLPIASADTLGAGKYQTNLVGAAVYAVSRQTFFAAVAKQLLSVAGVGDRADIVQGSYRLLVAHSTKSGWWFLADPQLWVDYNRNATSQLSIDFEIGKMVRPLTGVWLRAGSRLGGGWKREDWSVSGGLRMITF